MKIEVKCWHQSMSEKTDGYGNWESVCNDCGENLIWQSPNGNAGTGKNPNMGLKIGLYKEKGPGGWGGTAIPEIGHGGAGGSGNRVPSYGETVMNSNGHPIVLSTPTELMLAELLKELKEMKSMMIKRYGKSE